jgi:hypothetical protein
MSKYSRSGQYQLVRCVVTTQGDKPTELDLANSFSDITVYESIIDKTMSGSVSFVDTNNIVNIYGLGHGELVELEWFTMGMDSNPIKYSGRVYDITGPGPINDHASGFTLHFMSEEVYKSLSERAYSGHNDTIDNIIKELFKKVKSEKPIVIEPTKYLENIVFTGDRIFDAISDCAKMSVSSSGDYSYTFFENNQQFNFVPLANLYKQEPVVEFTYQSQPAYDNVKNAQEESFTVFQDFELQDNNKHIDDIMSGLHGVTSNHISLKHKFVETYTDSRSETHKPNLSKYPFHLNMKPNYNYVINVSANVLPRQAEVDGAKNFIDRFAIGTITISAGIYGNSSLKVGDICIANIPSYSSKDFTQEHFDPISGKFLIAEIKHLLTSKIYNQRLLLLKDGFEETLG